MSIEKLPVSLIIPTYNRVQKLFRLLKSLDKLNPIPDEIVIIDDHSADGTDTLLMKWHGIKRRYDKKILIKPVNKGPADSRNLGIAHVNNEVVAFTDDDVVVTKDWIKHISARLLNGESKLAGYGGVVLTLNDHVLGRYYAEHKILEAPRTLNYLPTVNCGFKRRALMEVKGFNTDFRFAGGEDTELCLKLRNKGYYFSKEKRAVVYHDFSPNFVDFCKMWMRYGKGTQLAIESARRSR
jgi:glycosyltransferase involved in cell wall biosynthesis